MIESKEIEILSNDPFKIDNILEDFGCSILEENSKKGHLYLNNHCIGFSAEDKGKDVFLNFNEIKQIILNGENIEIETHKENKINFFSFDDFNSAFNKINSIFKLYIENEIKEEKNFSSDSGDSNNDNDEANKRVLSKMSLNSSASNDTSSSSSQNIVSLKKENNAKSLKEAQSTEDIKKLVFDEEKTENNIIIKNNSSNDLNKNINLLEPKEKQEGKEIKEEKEEKEKNVEKEEVKEKKEEVKEEKEEKEEKQIIKEKIEFTKMNPDLDYEICKKIIDLPPKEFFEKYQTNKNPETSYEAYYKWVGEYSQINVQNWEKIESKEKKVIEKYQRKESFCLALHNVPLVNKSNVEKVCTYWIENDGTYYMHTFSKSSGVPLSDKFTVETFSEFHPFMNNTKTVFRTYVRTNIIKWSMFKIALISQGKKSYNQEVERWLNFITEKGDKIEGDYCI